jgi:hypothetical protein
MATSDRFSSLALPLDYPQKCDRFQPLLIPTQSSN